MIGDGFGFNGWIASKYYMGGLIQDNPDFRFYAVTTYMLDQDGIPIGYDPQLMWSDFDYVSAAFTDSAAAATALNSGQKVCEESINIDFSGNPLVTIAQIADSMGKATGVVTSVPISHGTPAAVFAHNVARSNYEEIANEMIYDSGLDVIMGTGEGHPTNLYVGGDLTWADITDGDGANGFTYVADLADFVALANGTFPGGLPAKVLGIAHGLYELSEDPDDMPDLETATRGALQVLSQDGDGFYLMVEGGAIDWMNHDNDLAGMLREATDFNNTIQTVINWIESNGGWEENLLIITADHETGKMWGPNNDGDSEYYEHVIDNGVGNIPGVVYYFQDHTNELVPLWAKGAGSERFEALIDGVDVQAHAFWGNDFAGEWDGSYIDNTDVFDVMEKAFKDNGASIPAVSDIGMAVLFLVLVGSALWIKRKRMT